MKEIVSAVFLLIGTYGVGYETKHIYDVVRSAALAKAAQGLPSLVRMNDGLHGRAHKSHRIYRNDKVANW